MKYSERDCRVGRAVGEGGGTADLPDTLEDICNNKLQWILL